MEIFKQLNKFGYKHYVDLTIEELDKLPIDNIERRIEYSLIIDWFSIKHNIWINIDPSPIKFYVDDVLQPVKFQYCIEDLINRDIDDFILDHSGDDSLFYDNSFEAREAAILKAIQIIKNRK